MNRRILYALIPIPTFLLVACSAKVLQFGVDPGSAATGQSDIDAGSRIDASDAGADDASSATADACTTVVFAGSAGPICWSCGHVCGCDWSNKGMAYAFHCEEWPGPDAGSVTGLCTCTVDGGAVSTFSSGCGTPSAQMASELWSVPAIDGCHF